MRGFLIAALISATVVSPLVRLCGPECRTDEAGPSVTSVQARTDEACPLHERDDREPGPPHSCQHNHSVLSDAVTHPPILTPASPGAALPESAASTPSAVAASTPDGRPIPHTPRTTSFQQNAVLRV
jgi:hypothetical protein